MFWTRLASGVVLMILALGGLGLGGMPLALLLWAVSLAGFRELTRALQHRQGETSSPGTVSGQEEGKPGFLEWIGFGGVTAYYLLLYFSGSHTALLLCVVGFFLAVMFAYVAAFPRYHGAQAAAVVFSFLYAPVLLSFVYQTRMSPQGIYTVWMILISSWGCDTCAYVVGKLLGKKKIFPVLSPKKSLEGCIGGVLGAGLIGWLYGFFFVGKAFPEAGLGTAWAAMLICGAGAVMSMAGDLAASGIKPDNGIKDYGKLIPGHGGIMDRFDSMIVTAPMTYMLALLMLQ